MGVLRIGTSGWIYAHWIDVFYPPGLPAGQELPFYAQRFSSVEINFSFYRLPEGSAFERWREQTPNDFLFAVKASRYLSHLKKLKDPADPLARLIERVDRLGPKLGPILVQLPPRWRVNRERLGAFLELAREYRPRRFALEFRDRSWLEPGVYRLLEQAGAALCLPVSPWAPLDLRLTAPWTYIRMHQGATANAYTDEELERWASRIERYLADDVDVYVYFNNDAQGDALRNAERLRAMLGAAGSAAAPGRGRPGVESRQVGSVAGR